MRLLAVALLFAANAALADTPEPAKVSDAPPQSVWRPGAGGYEHVQTGLVCPEKFAGYRRTDVVSFDNYGLDVGCNYTIGTAALTYYLTRREAPGGLDAAMGEAALQDGEQTLIFGYFAGRPSPELVGDLFARVLSGKQKPVGGYSAKGKTISIVMPSK